MNLASKENTGGSGWSYWAERFGVPVFFCLLMFTAFGICAHWVAANVVLPLVESHQDFLAGEKAHMGVISTATKQNAESNSLQAKISDDIRRSIQSQVDSTAKLENAVQKSAEGTSELRALYKQHLELLNEIRREQKDLLTPAVKPPPATGQSKPDPVKAQNFQLTQGMMGPP